MAHDNSFDVMPNETEIDAVSEKVSEKADKKISNYRSFRNSGLSRLDALFSSLYIKACEKSGTGRKILEKLSRPLSKLSPTSINKIRREKIGLFSDSSVKIVGKALGFFKKRFFECTACALAIVFALIVVNRNSKPTIYEVYVNGMNVGCVEDITLLNNAKSRAEQRVTDITGFCYDLPCTVSYTLSDNEKATLDEAQLYELFSSYTSGATCHAYGLYIDGKEIAVLENRDDITTVFETLEQKYFEITGEEAQIANTINISYEEFGVDEVISSDSLMTLLSDATDVFKSAPSTKLLSSSLPEVTAQIATPDTPDTPVSEVEPTSEEEVSSPSVVISYEVVNFETVREYVPYETRYIEDSTIFKGQTRVSKYGYNGLANVTYAVSSIDGEETGREVVSVSTIYEPVVEVIRIGTRDLPETLSPEANGGKYMILPVTNPIITDRYGARTLNGRSDYHYGLDMAANYGTPIYAAASGRVIYAQFNNSFGNCVKIEHADGAISLYAHCSELFVKVGDTVSQSDLIAKVGNTGYSFGNHCHMEVIVNGERVDPELYINMN